MTKPASNQEGKGGQPVEGQPQGHLCIKFGRIKMLVDQYKAVPEIQVGLPWTVMRQRACADVIHGAGAAVGYPSA